MTCSRAAASSSTRPPKTAWWSKFKRDLQQTAPAVVGSRDAQGIVAWHANLVLDRRDKPGDLRLTRMRRDRKTEIVGRRRQPRPMRASIGRAIDAGMVLHPPRRCG